MHSHHMPYEPALDGLRGEGAQIGQAGNFGSVVKFDRGNAAIEKFAELAANLIANIGKAHASILAGGIGPSQLAAGFEEAVGVERKGDFDRAGVIQERHDDAKAEAAFGAIDSWTPSG